MDDDDVTIAVKVPGHIRLALRALKLRRECAEGRPVTMAQIVAELVEREAGESERDRHA